jgi:hypothetical protein
MCMILMSVRDRDRPMVRHGTDHGTRSRDERPRPRSTRSRPSIALLTHWYGTSVHTVPSSTTIKEVATLARGVLGNDGVLTHVHREWTYEWNARLGMRDRILRERSRRIVEYGDDRDERRVVDVCHHDDSGIYAFLLTFRPSQDDLPHLAERVNYVEAFLTEVKKRG